MELPQNIIDEEKKRADAKDKQEKEKKKADDIAKSAKAYASERMTNAKTFTEKKVVVLDLIASLGDALYELSDSDRVEDFDKSLSLMQDWVNNLKEEKKTE